MFFPVNRTRRAARLSTKPTTTSKLSSTNYSVMHGLPSQIPSKSAPHCPGAHRVLDDAPLHGVGCLDVTHRSLASTRSSSNQQVLDVWMPYTVL